MLKIACRHALCSCKVISDGVVEIRNALECDLVAFQRVCCWGIVVPGGAGGDRTLVQTWNQCAFYMLIHDPIVGRK